MKTTINKIVWLCFIAIVSVSCSKNDDCDPKDEDSPCYAGPTAGSDLLLIEERTNGKTEMRFEYNDRNQVVVRHVHGVEGNVTHENFTYNGDKLIKVERRSNGELVMSEEFTYGAGNRPTKGIYKDNKGRVLANITYAYSVNKVTERSFNREGQQVGINTYTFDTIGKNIIKQVTGIQDISLVTIEYGDYDNKPCRYTNYPWAWKVGSANNARSQSLFSQVGGGAVASRNDRWEYTYNAAGYPLTAKVLDKASGKLVETRTFTYKKAN
ncbi:hypothetical protein [Sphingobacterium mizutaii]|uniref:hypothetical protein n=1 Tax=Sphingobacterium mizutaii TaxID=1010 RepID=UPI0016289809|nr:hypothetical protein [Sphingobacterium mizutaii]MBV2227634.1 hypothetical protein [Sphingobacterium mizutaii]